MSGGNLQPAIEATRAAARFLSARRAELRDALLSGDTDQVVRCARLLLGMEEGRDDEERDRPGSGIGSGPVGS